MKQKIWVVIILVVVCLACFIYLIMLTPSKGTIGKKMPTTEVRVVGTQELSYSNSSLKLKYLDKYILSETGNSIHLESKTGAVVSFVVTLRNDKATSLDDVSGVKMRQIKKEEYIQEKAMWNNESGIMFIKENPYEATAFFLAEGKSLTVAMTVHSNETKVYKDEFVNLISSISLIP